MIFLTIVFCAAFILEGLGSYISILGLASKASIVIVFIAISLDFGKIVVASILYKKWKKLSFFLKLYLVPAVMFLILITSTGTYGFLVQEFGKTVSSQEQSNTKIEALEKEKAKLEARKQDIDKQISQLPSDAVYQRKNLTALFSTEITQVNARIIELDKEIPASKINALEDNNHIGTIASIAKAYDTPLSNVVKIISFLIVLVIDPLAIALLSIGNFLVEERKQDKLLEIEKAKQLATNEELKKSLDKANFEKQYLLELELELQKNKNSVLKEPISELPKEHFEEKNISNQAISSKIKPNIIENKVNIKNDTSVVNAKVPTITKNLVTKELNNQDKVTEALKTINTQKFSSLKATSDETADFSIEDALKELDALNDTNIVEEYKPSSIVNINTENLNNNIANSLENDDNLQKEKIKKFKIPNKTDTVKSDLGIPQFDDYINSRKS